MMEKYFEPSDINLTIVSFPPPQSPNFLVDNDANFLVDNDGNFLIEDFN